MTANGVLNSCEASEVNCFSRSMALSTRSKRLLIFSDKTYNSSLFAGNGIRVCRLSLVILDEVSTGFTVWYVNTSGTLVMATNVGTTDDLTNQWLITAESDGSMPEVYINAP